MAVVANQNIRRLEVAVHNQIRMCFGYCLQHFEKHWRRARSQNGAGRNNGQSHPRQRTQEQVGLPAPVTPASIKSAMCSCARSARIFLAFEPLFACFPHECDIEELHGNPPFKASIVAFRKPHASHSPLADLRYQRVDAESLTCQGNTSRWQLDDMVFEKTLHLRGTYVP